MEGWRVDGTELLAGELGCESHFEVFRVEIGIRGKFLERKKKNRN
jgi:hypothetical protein